MAGGEISYGEEKRCKAPGEQAWEVSDFFFPTQISHTCLISSEND